MGILRTGRVQLRMTNWEESINYYKNVLGLIETAREDDLVYLKAWDEHDHHSVILQKADTAGLEHLAFKVESPEDLDMYEKKLNDYGVATTRIPAGTRIAEGEAVRFQLPTEQYVELYAEIEQVGNGLPLVNPAPWPDGLVGIAPPRLDHLLIAGEDVAGSTKLLMDVFGFSMAERLFKKTAKAILQLGCLLQTLHMISQLLLDQMESFTMLVSSLMNGTMSAELPTLSVKTMFHLIKALYATGLHAELQFTSLTHLEIVTKYIAVAISLIKIIRLSLGQQTKPAKVFLSSIKILVKDLQLYSLNREIRWE